MYRTVLLDPDDYLLLKTDIESHASEFPPGTTDQVIADAYNAFVSTFWVWKTLVTTQEIYESTSPDAAAPTWSWGTFKAQSVQERDAWVAQMQPGKINPSLKQTRDSYNVIFGGQGASLVQQNFLLALSRRQSRRIEQLLFEPTLGNGTTVSPANLGFEGSVSSREVAHALRGAPLQ